MKTQLLQARSVLTKRIWRREWMFRCLENGVDARSSFYVAHLWLCPSCNACWMLYSSTTLPHGNEDNREHHFPELKFSTAFFCCRGDRACCRHFLFSFYVCIFGIPEVLFFLFWYKWKHDKFRGCPWEQHSSPLDVLLETLLTMRSYCRSHLLLVETQLAHFIALVFKSKNWTWVRIPRGRTTSCFLRFGCAPGNHCMLRQGLAQPVSSFLMAELRLKRAGQNIMLSYVNRKHYYCVQSAWY